MRDRAPIDRWRGPGTQSIHQGVVIAGRAGRRKRWDGGRTRDRAPGPAGAARPEPEGSSNLGRMLMRSLAAFVGGLALLALGGPSAPYQAADPPAKADDKPAKADDKGFPDLVAGLKDSP